MLAPRTIYPDELFEKFKYNCLKSGALYPEPTDPFMLNLFDKSILKDILGLNCDLYSLCLSYRNPETMFSVLFNIQSC